MASVRVGEVRVSRLEELTVPGMPPEQWFPEYSEEEWQAHRHLCSPADLDPQTNSLTPCIQSWILETGGRVVIIDTGMGNDKPRPGVPPADHMHNDYLERLAQAGVVAEQVDLVLCTHVHMDHVGWNTRLVDGHWVPTFPNAKYVLSVPDLEFWDPANDVKYTRQGDSFMQNVYADSITPVLEAGKVERWEGEYVVDGTLRLEAAPGHTPGNAIIKVSSRGEHAVFIGDMMHSPVQIPLPHWNSCACEDLAAAHQSRVKTLGWAADNGALIFAGHFGQDQAAEVCRQGNTFALKAWKGFTEGDG